MNWRFVPTATLVTVMLTSFSAEAAFHSRLGGQAYYDDQLDITWAADANINGTDTWDNQVAWVGNLNIDGVAGWRLPNMDIDSDGTIVGCSSSDPQASCQDNEYGHLYYYGAGTAWSNGVAFGSPGPFSNIQAFSYWSNTVVAPVDVHSAARYSRMAFCGFFRRSMKLTRLGGTGARGTINKSKPSLSCLG